MTNQLYHYKARVLEVHGDAIIVEVDLGFRILFKELVRLYGINAISNDEDTEGAPNAHTAIKSLILDQEVLLETVYDRKGKTGRYFGVVHRLIDGKWININEKLVDEGLAVEVDY